jgi:hypothetical protein
MTSAPDTSVRVLARSRESLATRVERVWKGSRLPRGRGSSLRQNVKAAAPDNGKKVASVLGGTVLS